MKNLRLNAVFAFARLMRVPIDIHCSFFPKRENRISA